MGSLVVHAAIVVVLALAAVQWRSDPPPEQLAIEGNVVRYEDLPSSVKAGKPLREPAPSEPAPVAVPKEQPQPEPQPEPPVEAARDLVQEQKARVDAAARADAAAKAEVRARADAVALDRRKAAQAAATAQKTQEAAALAERKRAAAEQQQQLEEQRKQAALDAKLKQAEQEQSARDAKAKAAKEAELRRALEDEEAGDALARSGVVDEYRTLLIQTIERNWIRPGTARPGLECTLYVTQASGGTVLDVKIGECNGDQAVRESVANAVYRSSPLPAPRDARAFERRLVIVFKPTE